MNFVIQLEHNFQRKRQQLHLYFAILDMPLVSFCNLFAWNYKVYCCLLDVFVLLRDLYYHVWVSIFFFRYMFHFCFRKKVRITPWFCTQIKWQWFKIYFSVSCDKLFLKTKQKAKTKTKPLHSSFWVFFSLVTEDCFPEHSNENLPKYYLYLKSEKMVEFAHFHLK